MKVAKVMTKTVETCTPDQDLNRAAQIMWDADCGFVPVLGASGRIEGVITDRDLCMAAYTRGLSFASMRVGDVMTKTVVFCSPEDDLADAHSQMRRWRVRRLPVVHKTEGLVGVLSLNDIARAAEGEDGLDRGGIAGGRVASTLAAVGEHRIACPLSGASMKPPRNPVAVRSVGSRQADAEC